MARRGIMIGLFASGLLGGCNLLSGVADLVTEPDDVPTPSPDTGAPLLEASLPNLDANSTDGSVGDAEHDVNAADVEAGTLRVFVTSTTHPGNVGGIGAADAICNTLATNAGLGGEWVAWLSSKDDVQALVRLAGANGPWHLVTGELAVTKLSLAAPPIAHAINRTELGAVPPAAEDRVWTGTDSTGTSSGQDCAEWKGGGGANGSGRIGEARSNGPSWTSLGTEACGQVNRFYCFEL